MKSKKSIVCISKSGQLIKRSFESSAKLSQHANLFGFFLPLIVLMGKIKFGALVVDGRGKVGGHVMSKNRAGAYLRTKVTPVNRHSSSQVTARQRLTTNSQAWKSLTQAQRDAWNSAVANFPKNNIFGDQVMHSGFNLYQKLNNLILLAGGAVISVPPTPAAVPALITAVLSGVAATSLSLAYTPTPVPALTYAIVQMTCPLSQGRNFVASEFRNIAVIAPAAASPYVATADYVAKFGSIPPAGQKIFFRIFQITRSSGLISAYLQGSVTL